MGRLRTSLAAASVAARLPVRADGLRTPAAGAPPGIVDARPNAAFPEKPAETVPFPAPDHILVEDVF